VFPESPRWLLAHGKLEEAHKIIMKFGCKDDEKCDSAFMMSMIKKIREDQVKREKIKTRHTPLDLFRTRKLRRWTIIICFGW
jgi:hypothetical protein